jgi:hypothetical protein
MYYTIVTQQQLWRDSDVPAPEPVKRVLWQHTSLLVNDQGVVSTVLSSDPADFLRLYAAYPCGRMK